MVDNVVKTKISTSLGIFEFEGAQEFVEKQIEKILNESKVAPAFTPTSVDKTMESIVENVPNKKSQRKLSVEQPQMIPHIITNKEEIDNLREFYQQKSPESHIEIFAILTYWLKNNRQLSEVSINEMWTLYKILAIKPPKVLVQSFRDGKSKRAYFESGTTVGRYFLTPYGETFVEHDLPRNTRNK